MYSVSPQFTKESLRGRFGVLEYTTKTGRVWRHTEKKPNYLADPIKEIDATSFGTYVSMFEGEYIPLSSLILGPTAPVLPWQAFFRRVVKKATGAWPKYDVSYLSQFDVLLVVHELPNAHEMVRFLRRIKQLPQRPLLVGVPTQPYGLLLKKLERDSFARLHLADFVKECDIFISLVEETADWYRQLGGRSVPYLPQPYPVEFASKKFTPVEEKKKTILVAGVTERPTIIQGHRIARKLQQEFPEYTIVVPKIDGVELNLSELADTRYEILPFEKWQAHLNTLASLRLVINTDHTLTRGRVQTDCAAVGTVSLGGNSDAARDLFPDFYSTLHTPDADLIELGRRLLRDDQYYNKVAEYAQDQLEEYNYDHSRQRFVDLVNEWKPK